MFFARHPQPVGRSRAVAMLVVQKKTTDGVDRHVFIVENKASYKSEEQRKNEELKTSPLKAGSCIE